MSKQTDKSLFIVSSLPRLYQALLSGIESYKDLGNRIIGEIKTAHAFRHAETVEQLAKILINIPIKEYQLIGQYYLLLIQSRDLKPTIKDLETIIEQTQTYKAKALLSRGAVEWSQGKVEPALYFYMESIKAARTISDRIEASRCIAAAKAIEGFHNSALKDFGRLIPLLRYAEPIVFNDCLNSYAVELGEAGRKDEARNVIKHVIASPFAIAYPEWQETAQELKEPNRSFISVPESMPKFEPKHVEIETKPLPKPKQERNPANVLPFQKLKEAPEPEQPERLSPTQWDDMTAIEKKEFIMTALRTDAISERHYDNIAAQTGMLKTGPASKVIDLEDETVMTNKLIEWAHMIDPDELAGVMSALRDCDDNTRRANLIDAMIRKFFEYSSACGASEEVWRKKVERRLPKKDS